MRRRGRRRSRKRRSDNMLLRWRRRGLGRRLRRPRGGLRSWRRLSLRLRELLYRKVLHKLILLLKKWLKLMETKKRDQSLELSEVFSDR